MILIDTSAWIDFFQGKNTFACKHIESELESGSPALCGPIWLELIRGLRSVKEGKRVLPLLKGCYFLEQPDHLWDEAGELGRYLAQKGLIVGSLDLLIAIYILAHKTPFLTLDKDFKSMLKAGIPLELVDLS